ncbi:MAG: class I SAM-dependent methyltransferase [Chthoniobacterales bacterium]
MNNNFVVKGTCFSPQAEIALSPLPRPSYVARSNKADLPQFDHLARTYCLMEHLAFGRALERARFEYFGHLKNCRRILLLGDGDGRGLARACQAAPNARIDYVDMSTKMSAQARHRIDSKDRNRVQFRNENVLTAHYENDTYAAVTTLFFLDCFHPEQIQVIIRRVRPALKSNALWLHSDFQIPSSGWQSLRARAWLFVIYAFFRWQTGMTVTSLPSLEIIFSEANFDCKKQTTYQYGFLQSGIFIQAD